MHDNTGSLFFPDLKGEKQMLRKTVETIIGGAIGVIALYVVGKVAYRAGQEVAREECRLQSMKTEATEKTEESEAKKDTGEFDMEPILELAPAQKKSRNWLSGLINAGKILSGRKSVIGNLVRNPEAHRFEAYVEGDELQIHVKRREAAS